MKHILCRYVLNMTSTKWVPFLWRRSWHQRYTDHAWHWAGYLVIYSRFLHKFFLLGYQYLVGELHTPYFSSIPIKSSYIQINRGTLLAKECHLCQKWVGLEKVIIGRSYKVFGSLGSSPILSEPSYIRKTCHFISKKCLDNVHIPCWCHCHCSSLVIFKKNWPITSARWHCTPNGHSFTVQGFFMQFQRIFI